MREFDEHLCIELSPLIDQSDTNPDTADKQGSELQEIGYLHTRPRMELVSPQEESPCGLFCL